MRTRSRTTARAALGCAATSALVFGCLADATQAHATGLGYWLCGQDQPWAGYSNATTGAETKDAGTTCGKVGVAVQYRTYSTSKMYVTEWHYGDSYVVFNPNNITVGGIHKVASCGLVYTCGPQYT